MQDQSILGFISKSFNSKECALILTSLRQDPIIWTALDEPAFGEKAVLKFGDQFSYWNPADISALFAGIDFSMEELSSAPLIQLPTSLKTQALTAFELILKSRREPADPAESLLIALALRERRRLTHSWNGIPEELGRVKSNVEQDFIIWRTPFAILYRIINDPADLLENLASYSISELGSMLFSHIILSNPQTVDDKVSLLAPILLNKPIEKQLFWLKEFSERGNEELSEKLATIILGSELEHSAYSFISGLEKNDLAKDIENISKLRNLSALKSFSKNRNEALSDISLAQEYAQKLFSSITMQKARVAAGSNQTQIAVSAAKQVFPFMNGETKKKLRISKSLSQAFSLIGNENKSAEHDPNQVLKEAELIYLAGDPIRAKTAAESTVAEIVKFVTDENYDQTPGNDGISVNTLEKLIRLDFLEEVEKIITFFLKRNPTDPDLIGLSGLVATARGESNKAWKNFKLASSLKPTDAKWFYHTAELLQSKENFEEELEERRKVIALSSNPKIEDKLALGKAAFRSGKSLETIQICEDIITGDPENGSAHSLLGNCYQQIGDLDKAQFVLIKATLLSSKEANPWLALARVFEAKGDVESASATLRSGLLAVSDSAELNYEMSQHFLRNNLLSEAVPYLRKAASISPESVETAVELGKTLKSLGHTEEVHQVYLQASRKWPGEAKMAIEYGNLLAEEKKYQEALPLLETAIASGERDENLVVNYVRSLFSGDIDEILLNDFYDDEEKSSKAFTILKDMPKNFSSNPLLQVVLAIVHLSKKDYSKAFDIFREQIEGLKDDKSDLRWLLQAGLGIAAIQMGLKEVGITSLKDAVQAKPNNFKLIQKLAEIYLNANLIQDAYLSAQQALGLQPHNIENVLWYAKTMNTLGQDNEASDALRAASMINPEEPRLWLDLGNLEIKMGRLQEGKKAIDEVVKFENLTEDLLKKCAISYQTVNEMDLALNCLKKAVEKSENPDPQFLYETARMCKSAGDLETALTLNQRVISSAPNFIEGYLLNADILMGYDRSTAALENLETALHILDDEVIAQKVAESEEKTALKNENRNLKMGEIHHHYTNILARAGNFTSALLHADKAVSLNPGNLGYRVLAGSLASQLLLTDKVDQYTDLSAIKSKTSHADQSSGIGQDAMAGLFSLKIEKELDSEDYEQVRSHLEAAGSLFPSHPKLISGEVRLLKAEGKRAEAKALLENLQNDNANKFGENLDVNGPEISIDTVGEIQETLSQINVLVDFEKWKEALDHLQMLAQKYPSNPKVQLSLAKAMVLCAEEERQCDEIGITQQNPGLMLNDKNVFGQFKKTILLARKLTKSSEIDRWARRGELAFSDSPDSEIASSFLGGKLGDEPAMIAAMRRAGESEKVLKMVNQLKQIEENFFQLALCELDVDPHEGLNYLQKSFPENEVNPKAYSALFLLQKETGDLTGSARAIEEALIHFPDEPLWHLWAGEVLGNLAREEEAIVHLEKACELKPEEKEFKQELADQLLKTDKPQRALPILEEMAMEYSQDGNLIVKLANAYRVMGNYDGALAKAEEAIALMPKSVEPLLIKGRIYSNLGKIDEAESCGTEALEKNPSNVDAILFMSDLLRKENRLQENLDLLEKSIQSTGGSLPILIERARLVNFMDGPDEALPLFQKLADLNPDDVGILSELARAQATTGDLQAAEKSALTSLRINSKQPALHYLVGKMQLTTGQLDQAIQHLSEAIRLAPEDLQPYVELGQAYQARREFGNALKSYRQAVDKGIKDSRPYVQAGILMRDGKDFQGAESMFRRAAEMLPDDLSIRKQLAAVVTLNLVHNSQEANSTI